MKPGSLREAMPLTAAFIDEMREAFGADMIDAQIRQGIAGEPGFWASENGQAIGCKSPSEGCVITADQMVLIPREEKKSRP